MKILLHQAWIPSWTYTKLFYIISETVNVSSGTDWLIPAAVLGGDGAISIGGGGGGDGDGDGGGARSNN